MNNVSSNKQPKQAAKLRLLVTANIVPNWTILVTLMMEAIRSSESSVLTRATQPHISEGGILNEFILFVPI
jgi:hypothetical protein